MKMSKEVVSTLAAGVLLSLHAMKEDVPPKYITQEEFNRATLFSLAADVIRQEAIKPDSVIKPEQVNVIPEYLHDKVCGAPLGTELKWALLECKQTFKHRDYVTTLLFKNDRRDKNNRYLISASSVKTTIWDLAEKKQILEGIRDEEQRAAILRNTKVVRVSVGARFAAFSPDHSHRAFITLRNVIEIQECETGRVTFFTKSLDSIAWQEIVWSPNGEMIFLLCNPIGHVINWKLSKTLLKFTHLNFHPAVSTRKYATFSPDSKKIVAIVRRRKEISAIETWDIEKKACERIIEYPVLGINFEHVEYHPYKNILVASAERHDWGNLFVFDLDSGECLNVWKARREEIATLAFDEEGEQLATVDWNGNIKIWAAPDAVKNLTLTDLILIREGKKLDTYKEVLSLAFKKVKEEIEELKKSVT